MRPRTRTALAAGLVSTGLVTTLVVAPAVSAVPAPASPSAPISTLAQPADAAAKAQAAARAKRIAASRIAAANRANRAKWARQAKAGAGLRLKVAVVAKRKAGRASYVAGATGPNAFDCSGFSSWAWRQAGKSIPRTSYAQFAALRKISRSQARAGDLVFFFGRGAHHVGVYLGNGRMVHAANPRSDVNVVSIDSSWYSSRLSGFRRVA